MYLICSLRTNIVFMVIFLTLTIGFELLAGASWQLANGNTGLAHNLNVVSYTPFTHSFFAP